MTLRWQVGEFFVLLGVLLLIIFFITGQVDSPIYWYFCIGVPVLGLGIFFMWTGRNPVEASKRFRIMRNFSERREKKKKKGGG
jgi:hypothetical protein